MIPHSKPTLGAEEKLACLAVIDSGQIAQAQKVAAFEKAFAAWTGRRFAVAVSSGTSALTLSLAALGITHKDDVIIPSYTCVALLHALHAVGARPVPVDIDLEDFNIAVEEIRRKIRKKTKAIIVPHAFGRAARVEEILALGIPVIEDGTQALGARVGHRQVGSFGVLSLFSFYATKMMTTGEGGMVVTDSSQLAHWLADARDYDKKRHYRFRINAKMTDLEAAIGIEQLKKIPGFITARREIAAVYHKSLKDFGISLPSADSYRDHVYFRYVIRVSKSAGPWIRALNARGIEAKTPIFQPVHRYLGLSDSKFPMTVKAMKENCSLPIFPLLGSQDQAYITGEIAGLRSKQKAFA